MARRQRRHRGERRADVAQRALARLQCELGTRGQCLGARDELQHACVRVAPGALIVLVRRRVARGKVRVGRRQPVRARVVDRDVRREIAPLAPRHAHAPTRRGEIRIRRGGFELDDELGEPSLAPLRLATRSVRERPV